MKYALFSTLFFLGFLQKTIAQNINKEDYQEIDGFAQKCGAMQGYSLGFIVDSITKTCNTELQMTRAFYCWAATFVDFDFSRQKHPNNNLDNASSALMDRKASSAGFADLFQSMCDLKKINCTVVQGYIRNSKNDIGHFNENKIHYWNTVTINNTKYLMDVSLAGGDIASKRTYNPNDYTDAWWLSNRTIFLYAHFPKDKANQLLLMPFTKQEITRCPIISAHTIVRGLMPNKAFTGLIKGISGDTLKLKFSLASLPNITTAEVVYDNKVHYSVPFDIDQFGFYLFVPNGNEGKHLAQLYANGKLVFTYKTNMRKAFKKRK